MATRMVYSSPSVSNAEMAGGGTIPAIPAALEKLNSSTKGGNYCVSEGPRTRAWTTSTPQKRRPKGRKVLSRELVRDLVDTLNVLYRLVKNAFCRLSGFKLQATRQRPTRDETREPVGPAPSRATSSLGTRTPPSRCSYASDSALECSV